MKRRLRVRDLGDAWNIEDRYMELFIPKRSIFIKDMKLKAGDFVWITLKKEKKKR